MTKIVSALVVFALMATSVTAQEPIPVVASSPLRINVNWAELKYAQKSQPDFRVEVVGEKVADKKFWLVSLVLPAMMALDTHSTFPALDRCPECWEMNPLARPFVEMGPGPTYAAGFTFDAVVIKTSHWMKGSRNPALRRIWWVPSAVLIAYHGWAIQNNNAIPDTRVR